jgi:hypothetical protein
MHIDKPIARTVKALCKKYGVRVVGYRRSKHGVFSLTYRGHPFKMTVSITASDYRASKNMEHVLRRRIRQIEADQ